MAIDEHNKYEFASKEQFLNDSALSKFLTLRFQWMQWNSSPSLTSSSHITRTKAHQACVSAFYVSAIWALLLHRLVISHRVRIPIARPAHLFHPVCFTICSSFSLRGSGSRPRYLRFSISFSRLICLACFSVGRRKDHWSWPNMLVLIASTQYGHRMCIRLTRPHPEHLFSAVTSLRPLPARNRWRFLRYDVFFFGTAFRMPSHTSARDGIAGSEREGIARAPNGVDRAPRGCVRRCRKGNCSCRAGRTGALRAGKSVCHSGGSGRARAMAVIVNWSAWKCRR